MENNVQPIKLTEEDQEKLIEKHKGNSALDIHPEIVEYWDYERNGDLKPNMVSKSSGKKIWLKCDLGHSFLKSLHNVYSHLSSFYCPYCSGNAILDGFNDLETTHPEVAKHWDYEKNENLTPKMVRSGSPKKVWWLCDKGHSNKSEIREKVNAPNSCPFCSGNRILAGFNDIATTHPYLLEFWDYEKNTKKPTEVSKGSNVKIWWKCKLGHSYEANMTSRIQNDNYCPYCGGGKVLAGFNDLTITHPELVKTWDYERNGDLLPTMVTKGLHKVVWWKCEKESHSYEMEIAIRTSMGVNCPYCAGKRVLIGFNDIESQYPEIAKTWDYEKNGDLKPTMVTKGCNKKVWWKCEKGHSFYNTILHRIAGDGGCPYCFSSKGEDRVQQFLEDNNIPYKKQYRFPDCVYVAQLRFDFAILNEEENLKCLIEFDGIQHFKPTNFSGGSEERTQKRFEDDQKRDAIKNEYCKKNKIPLIRISYKEISKIEEILTKKLNLT